MIGLQELIDCLYSLFGIIYKVYELLNMEVVSFGDYLIALATEIIQRCQRAGLMFLSADVVMLEA